MLLSVKEEYQHTWIIDMATLDRHQGGAAKGRLEACIVVYTLTSDLLTTQVLEPLERRLDTGVSLVLQSSVHRLRTLLVILHNLTDFTVYLNTWFVGQQSTQHSYLKEVVHGLGTSLEKEAPSLYKIWGKEHPSINLQKVSDIEEQIAKLHRHLEKSLVALQTTVSELIEHGDIPTQANNDINCQSYTAMTGYRLHFYEDRIAKIKAINTLSEIENKGPGCLLYILDILMKQLMETT